MAFNDTLFQLGMDLTRSSPAQKEDLAATAQGARAALEDTKEDRGSRHGGRHLLIDLYGAKRLDDVEHVERTLARCVEASGATLLHLHLQPLHATGGVTGVAVLAESHISIHSWPRTGYAALDVFMSGSADAMRAIPVLQEAFGGEVRVKSHRRGSAPGETRERTTKAPVASQAARPRTMKKAKVAA